MSSCFCILWHLNEWIHVKTDLSLSVATAAVCYRNHRLCLQQRPSKKTASDKENLGASLGFYRGSGEPEVSGASSDLMALMAAVTCGSNGH